MSDNYCEHCGSWVYSSDASDSYSYDEDSMSSDDWQYNAEEMADRSPLKRTRSEAGLPSVSDNEREKKRFRELTAMDVDSPIVDLTRSFANIKL